HAAQEPPVDLRQVLQIKQVPAAAERFGEQEQPLVVRLDQALLQRLVVQVDRILQEQTVHADLQRTDRLQQRLFERPADAHYLAGRLHLRTQLPVRVYELVERPTRNFRDDIVDRRLEECVCLTRDRVH